MVTLTLLRLIVGGIKLQTLGKEVLKTIDNSPPGAFYSPRPLRQLGTKE